MSHMTKYNRRVRLLYMGHVPVEASYHGSVLLFRLLQDWPDGNLHIVESNLLRSQPLRRLPQVLYSEMPTGNQRLLHTRFAALYAAWLMKCASRKASRLERLVNGFYPEAVLTVTHGFSWLTAARFALERSLPLHLICHDDLPRSSIVSKRFSGWLDDEFGRVYRQAISRLCVSPFMVEEYERRYGVRGSLLYPNRAADCPLFITPPDRLAETGRPLVVAFGGTINSGGHIRALRELALVLQEMGGELYIYGPNTESELRRAGLCGANVKTRGLVPSSEFVTRMRDEVDVLFTPMSFAQEDRSNMSLCFPSKLTDYTATGLPLLIYGPPSSSAIRWAKENTGVAEIVDSETSELLGKSVRRLATDARHRLALGQKALEIGRKFFGYEAGRGVFHDALLGLMRQEVEVTYQGSLP